jgi:hypothetical protein
MQRGAGALLATLALAACTTTGPAPPPVRPAAAPDVFRPAPPAAPVQPPAPDAQASTETIWSLRGGLNVAALLCGSQALAASYNQFLKTHRGLLNEAYASEQARYRRAHGSNGEAEHSRAMTRLYNRFSLAADRRRYCAAAGQIMGEFNALSSDLMARRAQRALAALDAAAPAIAR